MQYSLVPSAKDLTGLPWSVVQLEPRELIAAFTTEGMAINFCQELNGFSTDLVKDFLARDPEYNEYLKESAAFHEYVAKKSAFDAWKASEPKAMTTDTGLTIGQKLMAAQEAKVVQDVPKV